MLFVVLFRQNGLYFIFEKMFFFFFFFLFFLFVFFFFFFQIVVNVNLHFVEKIRTISCVLWTTEFA